MVKPARTPASGVTRYAAALAAATLGLFMLCAAATSWAALRARIDRQTVQEGDTLTLTIRSDRAQSEDRPDVSPLRKDFVVLGTSTSSETSIVNGSRSDSTSWQIQLQPLHSGAIDIPPIAVGSEQTTPIEIDVTKASSQQTKQTSAHVFLEVEAPAADKSIYVQQQIPYTVRLYYDDSVQSGDLAAPDPENAIVEQLGQENRYTAMRNGHEYTVIERRYAIAPERSGTLHIPPASFRGTMLLASNSQGNADQADDPMQRLLRGTPFANDPFFKDSFGAGMGLGATPQPVAIHSQAIALEVQPLPAGVHGNWLPAEQVSLHDSWDDNPPQFKVGEPVTRTITIDAKGLAGSQIPSLSFAQPANARLYPEAPGKQSRTDGNVIYGTSKQSVTYIPSAPGTLEVPPVELAWWNTQSNAPSRAVLPAREFKVAAGAATVQSNAAPPTPATPQATAAATPLAAWQPPQGNALTERLQQRQAWFEGGAALLAMGLVSVVAIRRRRRTGSKSAAIAAPAASVPVRKAVMRVLQQACAGNDRHAAAAALLDLAWAEWPDDPPRGLGALAARLEAGRTEVSGLDRSLYGTGASPWEGSALWNAISRGLRAGRSEDMPRDDSLGALYPDA